MATYRKNVAVGATMIVALCTLGFMIILFGDAPVKFFRKAQMPLTLRAESAEGITTGSPVLYLGVNVGKVNSIERAVDQPGVMIKVAVERHPPLPANVDAVIRSTLIGGTASISLEPRGGVPQGQLTDNTTIAARVGGTNLLPREFTELAKRLTELSVMLQTTVDDWNKSKVIDKVAATIDTIHKTVADLDKTLGDDQMRDDLRQTLANFKTISEKLSKLADNVEKVTASADKVAVDASVTIKRTGEHVDDLSKQIAQRLDQVAGILEKFQSVANKVDQGEGTAGKLINDPKLYEALLDTSRELNLTVKDLRRLVEQWEQEGVTLKLGGKK
jgi:phospholipid/cholesterol/gamma-HCH transport system substrate-binding protein